MDYSNSDLGLLASPFAPLASRAHARAEFEAAKRGLVCIGATYPLTIEEGGRFAKTLTFNGPQSEGPVVITDIQPPRSGHESQTLRVKIDSTWMEDTVLPVYDSIIAPRIYCGHLSSSPLVLRAGGQMDFHLDDDVAYGAGEGIQLVALSVREQRKPRGLGAVDPELADEWAQAVRFGGQRWGISVTSNKSGALEPETINNDVIVECIVVSEPVPIEGQQLASDIKIKIDDVYLNPGTPGALLSPTVEGRRALVMPGLTWPVANSSQLSLTLSYTGVGTNLPVTVTLLGRVGGAASACWR